MPKDMLVKSEINANGITISVITPANQDDYISLTDIARHRNPEFPADVVKNWLRIRSTIEFLGLWEALNNPNFNVVEFDQLKTMPVLMRLCSLLANGLNPQMQ